MDYLMLIFIMLGAVGVGYTYAVEFKLGYRLFAGGVLLNFAVMCMYLTQVA